jgi:hypothetical protein
MQVQVIYDDQGRIRAIHGLKVTGPQPDKTRLTAMPPPGQRACVVEIPPEHNETPLVQLHDLLRVDTSSGSPKLVSTRKSKGG